MARSRKFTPSHEESLPHGNRPWVYVMIDAFFLITMFFVMTFHVKVDEKVLPQQMPPGGPHGVSRTLDSSPTLPVHVMRNGTETVYRVMSTPVSLDELDGALQRSSGAGLDCTVKVSYEPSVPFGDVMAVFNASTKAGLRKCGLVPLRSGQAL